MSNENYLHSELTGEIIQTAYEVHNILGYGFTESVYEKALEIKLNQKGFDVMRQVPIRVHFLGHVIGDFRADLLVQTSVILEIKAIEKLAKQHEVQLVNYLRATAYEVGLLVNFGQEVEIKRKVFSNQFKRHST